MIDLGLHRYQREVMSSPARYKLLLCGRRFGKTRLQVGGAIADVFEFQGQIDPLAPSYVMLGLPTLKQARKVLWAPLKVWLAHPEVKPWVAKIDNAAYTVDFHGGLPPIQVVGFNDAGGDNLRGTRLYSLRGDEWQDVNPVVWKEVLRPAMADTPGSRGTFTFTPKGKLNHCYRLWEAATDNAAWQRWHFLTADNPYVPRAEIEQARLDMAPRAFRQEFEASFEDYPGQIYAIAPENRTLRIPLDPEVAVIGIDWGDVNPAFVLYGRVGQVWHCLEGWRNPSPGVPCPMSLQLEALASMARRWPMAIASFADPSRPSNILDVRNYGRAHGLEALTNCRSGFNRIEEGIGQIQNMLHRGCLVYAGENPYDHLGVEPPPGYVGPGEIADLMASYHRKVVDEVVTETIADGQDDHLVDATRYALAMSP